MPQISVLVPVYNAERFLSACLDSILTQTYKDFELICVDDASTDSSLQILQTYAQRDPRVRIITQSVNQGVAQTRNILLSSATGKYIAFVDADDIILPAYLETLYKTAQENDADLVRCLFLCEDIKTGNRTPCEKKFKGFLRDVPAPTRKAHLQAAIDDTQVWLKLIKNSLIQENKLSFRPHSIAEDFPFEILLYQYAAKIAFVPEHLYVYRMGNNLSLSANPAPRAYSTLGNMIFLCQDLPRRQLAEPLFYNRIVNLTLKAVKRMRKYSFPPSYETGKLCRRAFETIQKNISYCSPIKRKKVKMICRFSKFIKDENLPYYALYFTNWFK